MNHPFFPKVSKLIDKLSAYFAARKGLLPMLGIMFVVLNFVLQNFASGYVVSTNLFLHLGIIITIIGFLLAWAL